MSIHKRTIIIIGVVVAAIGIILVGHFSQKSGTSTGSDHLSPNAGAYLVYQDKAYLPFSIAANNLLKDDVAYFARKNFTAYDPSKQPSVVFNLSGKPATKGATTNFAGQFEKVKDKITISVTLLKNDRIRTDMVDTATGANVNDLLPSHSVRNQYIATLPVKTDSYTIEYLPASDGFLITLYDESGRASALDVLQAGLKLGSLNAENYKVLTPSSVGDGAPAF